MTPPPGTKNSCVGQTRPLSENFLLMVMTKDQTGSDPYEDHSLVHPMLDDALLAHDQPVNIMKTTLKIHETIFSFCLK